MLCRSILQPHFSLSLDIVYTISLVWLVRPTAKDPDRLPCKAKRSALDHAEDMALLEMGGRKMHSKEIREQDAKEERERV